MRLRGLRARFVSIGALAVAAAAGLVLVARHPGPSIGARGTEAGPAAEVARAGLDDGASETFGDVADLDAGALHRLLDRLGHHGPVPLASGDDGADVPSDDEARVSDAIAELDGDALRRVASSLETSAL